MAMKVPFLLLLALIPLFAATESRADDTRVVSGSSVYIMSEDMSEKEAKARALEAARINALAESFGTFVNTSTSMTQREGSENSSESFSLYSTSDVAGIWIKTLEESVERHIQGRDIVIEAHVKGKARPREVAAPEFEAEVGRVDDSFRLIPATSFNNRERFDIRFVSPRSGYVTIYASDGVSDAARLLPEASANVAEPVYVERGREYRFFEDSSPVMALGPDEQNAILRITILFQPETKNNAFTLPVDASRVSEQGDILGWSVSQKTYQSWLGKMMNNPVTQRRDISVAIHR